MIGEIIGPALEAPMTLRMPALPFHLWQSIDMPSANAQRGRSPKAHRYKEVIYGQR